MKAWLGSVPEIEAKVRDLEKRNLRKSLTAILTGYAGFALAVYLVTLNHWAAYLIAICIIGNRLQSFENLLHEAGHGNLAKSAKLNDFMAEYLIALPIMKSFPLYRPTHLGHHKYLGSPETDPDYIPPTKPGESSVRIFANKLFSRVFLRHSLIGEWLRCSPLARFKIVGYFALFGAIVWWATGLQTLLTVWLVWMIARLTVYNFLMVFQELSDHQGLEPGGIYSFSRNAPLNLWAPVFHPHNSGLHLLHHLKPKIPFFNLPEADKLFLQWPRYVQATRCPTYLVGDESVVESWKPEAHEEEGESRTEEGHEENDPEDPDTRA